jgi:cytochrome P450
VSAVAAPPHAVDLSDPRSFAGGFPHDMFTWLRAHAPVWWHEPTAVTPDGEGFWVVSSYEHVMAVLRDPDTYSSETGGGRVHGGTAIKDERQIGELLNLTDDPKHRRMRSLVNAGFTPRAIEALGADIRGRLADLLDRCPVGEPFEFVSAVASELPLQVICSILGIPQDDRRLLCDWMDRGIETASGSIIAPEYSARLREYGIQLIAAKRREPADDVLSTVVHARSDDDGSTLTDRELLGFFALLFPAGAETTRSAIAGAVKIFVDHPDQFARLQADPGLAPAAAEEVVRWTTPSVYKRRTATRDTELGGVPIRAGDKVVFWEMSANRDERVFERPFEVDLGRTPNPHVGFGWGVHFCLGAHLARLELRTTLEELAARYDGFEAAGPYEWMPNNRLFGLRRLPVRALARTT